jgi:hypothetical protein
MRRPARCFAAFFAVFMVPVAVAGNATAQGVFSTTQSMTLPSHGALRAELALEGRVMTGAPPRTGTAGRIGVMPAFSLHDVLYGYSAAQSNWQSAARAPMRPPLLLLPETDARAPHGVMVAFVDVQALADRLLAAPTVSWRDITMVPDVSWASGGPRFGVSLGRPKARPASGPNK